ncbi:CAP Gly-rich domain-containing protein [Pelagophyceae sp. CCMP2097]|nr:CAP Gly-rich domain-containing protein [Pelagophyceae sp. CCMP2097]
MLYGALAAGDDLDGDAMRKLVVRLEHNDAPAAPRPPFRVGRRVRDRGGHAGTVRYVGPVATAKQAGDVYVGVEWDDGTRGKHDGEVTTAEGTRVRYFGPTAGTTASLVKPKGLTPLEDPDS